MQIFTRKLLLFIIVLFIQQLSIAQCTVSAGNDTSFCQYSAANITATTSGNNLTSVTWNSIPSGTSSTGATFVVPTSSASTFVYVVTAVFQNCIDNDTITITINPKPSVNFSSGNNICSGTNVNFNSTVSGGTTPYNYQWTFGGGGTSNNANPVHVFTSLGCGNTSFNNTLILVDSKGCRDTASNPINILQAPDVQLTDQDLVSPFSNCDQAPTPGNPNFTITVTNTSPGNSCVSSYTLNWGDGSPALTGLSLASFPLTHTYTQLGAFDLTITGFGTNGCNGVKHYQVANQSNPGAIFGTLGNTTNLCAPYNIPFIINNWQNNSPGTTYTLYFGDGSSVVFNHPLNTSGEPDTVYHSYTTSSCPQSPSYTATLVVKNACDSTPYTAGNIKIVTKPTASFTVINNPGCAGQNICFNNTSIPGYGGNNCNAITTYSWDFGDPASGTNNTSNLSNPCHIFSGPGTYTVTLTANTPSNICGPSVITNQVCIQSPPSPAFTASPLSGCSPLTVTFSDNSGNLNQCGVITRVWNVSKTSSNCPADSASDFVYVSGTNANSLNPVIRFNNQGNYSVSLSLSNSCGTFTSPATAITVKTKPRITLNAPSSVCAGQSINPTATINNCGDANTNYNWLFPGGSPANSSSQTPGAIAYGTVGTYNISLDVTNNCGTTNASQAINVNNVTQANAGPAQNVCGSTITLAGNTATVGTGTWTFVSGPNTPVITTPSSPTSTVTGMIPGTYIFQWTIANGSCTSSSTVTIIISSGPTTANAGPNQQLCLATSTNLSANNPTVGTGQWSFVSGPNTPTITTPNSNNTSVTGLIPGTYIFRWTISFSNCTPSSADVQVIIYDNPSAANAGSNQSICASSATLNGNTPAVGNGTWSLVSGPNTPSFSNVNAPNCTITNLIAGTYLIKWTISNGPCPASNDTVQIDVTGTPSTAFAGNDQRWCALNTVTLNGNIPTSGSGQWTYVSGPAGSTITNPASPSTSVTGLVTGTYIFRWTITNGICPPSSDDIQVIIDQDVNTADAGPPQNVCGSSITMAANTATVGSGLWSYVSGPAGSTITNPSSPTTTITGLVPGSYVFRWTISNGSCSSSSNVNIIISTGPTNAAAGADQRFCAVSSSTLNANAPVIGTGIWTQVSGPNTATIANPNSNSTGISNLIPGTYVFRWTISFSNCTPSTDDVQVIIDDNPTPAFAGNDQIICIPNATISGNTATTGTGAWTFISGPNTPTIVSPGNNTTNVTGLIQGVYLFGWTISNGVCAASRDTVQITVTGVNNNTISSNQQICINTAAALITGSVPSGGNGSFSYQWQQSTDGGVTWNNISGANNPDYDPGILIQTTCYRRIVSTSLCNGPQSNTSGSVCITVNQDAKALFSFVKDSACAPFILSITNTSPSNTNGTYNWYANNNFIGTGTSFPGYAILNSSNSVTIKLVAISAYGCKSDSTQHTFYTLPTPAPSFTVSDTVGCGPLTVTFNNTTPMADTFRYQWDFANGQTSTLQQPGSITFNSNPNYGDTIYTVKLYGYNDCDTIVFTKNIRVQSKPHAAINPSSTIGCSPMHVTFSNNSQGLGVTYYWNFGDGVKDTTYNNNNVLHTYNTGVIDSFTVTLIAVNHCGSDTQHVDIVVTPINIQPAVVINGSQLFGCAPHTVTFINNSTGASQLFWDFGDGTPIVTTANAQVQVPHTYFTSGNFTVSIKLQNNCTDTTILRQITVYDPPQASFTLNKLLACVGDTITTNNSSQGANAYEWFWGDNSSTVGFNASHIYTNPGTYQVVLVAKRTNNFGIVCTDTSSATTVTVLSPITAQINIDPSIKPCAPYLLNVSAVNTTGASQLQWVFYDSSTAPGVFYQTGVSASYVYNKAGTYSVKLIIRNAAGCVDSTTQTFTVYRKPLLSFTPLNVKTCNTDTTASFHVTVNYAGTDPVNIKWFINDQLSGQSNPFIYHFTAVSGVQATNIFNIKVLAENAAGCGDTVSFGSFTIQTIARPHIDVSPAYVQEQPNYTFTFKDTVAKTPSKVYLWMPGDRNGLQLNGQQITYTYGDTGTYLVKLLVTDYETGCADKDSVRVTVLYVPGFLYVPDAFCPGCSKAELRQFLPLGKGLKTYRLRIFNTWGQKIFETTSLDANGSPNQAWDGRWNGQPAQQDAYGWQIEATFINDTEWKGMKYPGSNRYVKSGFITVVR
jgi:PKD repeat protein